jgi:Fic family protein
MVALRKRIRNDRTYYYLEHSVRKGGKVVQKEQYLGRRLPEDVEQAKRAFISRIYAETWFERFDEIKRNYLRERRKTPASARKKEGESFAIRFTYDTNRMEGSTLTLRETANLLENGISPGGRPVRDIKEAESHRRVFHGMLGAEKDLSLQMCLRWHRDLFRETKPDVAGRIRRHQVAISGSRFMPPLPIELDALLEEFFIWYRKNRGVLHPVELAGLVHLRFVTIHPFADGNGRVSRLMMNLVLHRSGFPLLTIPYERRGGYYNALEKAQTKGDDHLFLRWFFKMYLKEHARYLESLGKKRR